MTERFENFNDRDEAWLNELELRAAELETELFDWRDAHARELADTSYSQNGARRTKDGRPEMLRAQPRRATPPRSAKPLDDEPDEELYRGIDDEDDPTTVIRTGSRPGWPDQGRRRSSAEQRTQALIDQGRRSASRARPKSHKRLLIGASVAAVIAIASFFIFRPSPSWPPSVPTVQSQITTACQNPNVASEPGQVNFACGKDTSQILWVFALMTSGNNPKYADAKTGRKGLEPIKPTQGGEVAWSLNLHHPYDPMNPVDSLQVAARAINNIIGGATITGSNGKPVVQPGLLSNPDNCIKYTGSSAVVSRANFPDVCAQPVSSSTGQAALVSDTYRQWVVGATDRAAYEVGVLFANANNPGNPEVQAILKTLPTVK
jgi:hypothetical protein